VIDTLGDEPRSPGPRGERDLRPPDATLSGVEVAKSPLPVKTMLATATLAAQGNPIQTWVGATVGIILSGVLGVLLGRVFGARLLERVTRVGSAVLFAVFGAVLLVANL
jgi:hypothetical protein